MVIGRSPIAYTLRSCDSATDEMFQLGHVSWRYSVQLSLGGLATVLAELSGGAIANM